MKSYFDLSRLAVFSTAMVLVSLLAGCGQKGPLFLPTKPDVSKAPQKPVPAPSAPIDGTAPASQK